MKKYTPHEHQIEAFAAIKNAIREGTQKIQVLFPTGGGKTNTEIETINYIFKQCEKKGHMGIAVVLSPRIQLCIQHMKSHAISSIYTVDTHPMALHSGYNDVNEGFLVDAFNMLKEDITDKQNNLASVICATSESKVREEYNRVMAMRKHFIIFATYHSAERLAGSGIPIDVIIADEAQYLVGNEFSKLHTILNAPLWAFFTATQKFTASSKGLGMNNEDLFGKVVYHVEPRRLIEAGIIVPPRLHVLYAEGFRADGVTIASKKTSDGRDNEGNFKAVKEIINKQCELTSGDNEKILVACKDTSEVLYLGNKFLKDQEFSNYTFFHTTSAGGNFVNDKKVTRGEFLEKINKCKGRGLIFHYDILSEGIDVDGISGVVFLRAMGLAKTLQTIGRALRVLSTDRAKPIEERIKQQAWVSVPVVITEGMSDNDYVSLKENLHGVISAMILGGYDVETVSISRMRGLDDGEVEFDDVIDSDIKGGKFGELYDLDKIRHEIMETIVVDELNDMKIMLAESKNIDAFILKVREILG